MSYSFDFCEKYEIDKGDKREEEFSWFTILGDTVYHCREVWWQEQNGADCIVFTVKKQKEINDASQFSFYSFWDSSSWAAATNIQGRLTSDEPFSEVYSGMCPEVCLLGHFKFCQVENQD